MFVYEGRAGLSLTEEEKEDRSNGSLPSSIDSPRVFLPLGRCTLRIVLEAMRRHLFRQSP